MTTQEVGFPQSPIESNTCDTQLTTYNPDYPVSLKEPVILLTETVEKINNNEPLCDDQLKTIIMDANVSLHFGIGQLKNRGYVTEGMENGEPTPDWVPIKKEIAIREAMEFLKNDPNLNPPKVDKRSKASHTEEEWEEKQKSRKEKMEEKKRKLNEYDSVVEERDHYKNLADEYYQKYKKYKGLLAEKHNTV